VPSPSKPPSLSAIIVNYNSGDRLRAAVHALQTNTTNGAAEIIVVDSNSSDDSLEGLCDGPLPVVIVRCQQNVHFCRGNNIGVNASSAEFVVFTQPDGEVQPGWDAPLIEALSQPAVVVAGGLVLKTARGHPIDSAGMAIAPNLGGWSLLEWLDPEAEGLLATDAPAREVVGVSPAFLATRRHDHLAIGGFREDLKGWGDEADYALNMRRRGRAVLVPQARMLHQVGASAAVRSPGRIYLSSRNQIWNAFRHLPARQLFVALLLSGTFNVLQLTRAHDRETLAAMGRAWRDGLLGARRSRSLSTPEQRAESLQYISPLRDYLHDMHGRR
jgi:N-acetylglucosaminyl-diphospho-decaprenol L-rhamnosyltransferase